MLLVVMTAGGEWVLLLVVVVVAGGEWVSLLLLLVAVKTSGWVLVSLTMETAVVIVAAVTGRTVVVPKNGSHIEEKSYLTFSISRIKVSTSSSLFKSSVLEVEGASVVGAVGSKWRTLSTVVDAVDSCTRGSK